MSTGFDRYFEFFERIRRVPREALVPFYIASLCLIEWIGFHAEYAGTAVYYGWLNKPQVSFD